MNPRVLMIEDMIRPKNSEVILMLTGKATLKFQIFECSLVGRPPLI